MSKTKKIISVVLAAALIMAMATVAMISASAATTVYFENSEGWSEVNCYTFVEGASNEGLGSWPGSPCTLVEGNVWSMDVPDDCTHIIFNAGNGGPQTNNLVNQGGGYIAKLGAGTETGEYGETKTIYAWEVYADAPVVTTEATTAAPVETEATTAAPVETEATTAAPVVTEPATTAPVVTEPTEAPATEDEPVVDPATDDEEPVVTEPTEAPVVTEPVATTAAPVVTEPAATTAAPVVTEPAGDDLGLKVGDVITYIATLETPKNIENIQATLTYSADTLKLVDATVAERFPNISGVVSNAAVDGVIYFNASEISTGFDFVGGKTLVMVQFEVIAEGAVSVETAIEEMVEFFGPDYVTGGEIVADGVALTDELILPDVTPTTTETAPVTTEATTATTEATTAEKTTDVQSSTDAPDEEKDVVDTGVAAAIYVVLAVLSMAAAAVVVLRKKVNG